MSRRCWGSISVSPWTLMRGKKRLAWHCLDLRRGSRRPSLSAQPLGAWQILLPASCLSRQRLRSLQSAGPVLPALSFAECPDFLQLGSLLLPPLPSSSLPPGPTQMPILGPLRKCHRPSDCQLPSRSGHSSINPVFHPCPQMNESLQIGQTPPASTDCMCDDPFRLS